MSKIENDTINEFQFERGRGIIWVCDIKDSSMFLNEDHLIDDFEIYLKRFYWISRRIVEAANGTYIKWTGDGFLAWFPCELKRRLIELSNVVLSAAYHLTMTNNITQFEIDIKEKVLLRHGVTFEEDALITKINSSDLLATDILGRNVVLAFRLSSFEHFFPNITVQGDLVSEDSRFYHSFKKMDLTDAQVNKVFKGQKYQTENLYQLDMINSLKNSQNEPLDKKLEDIIEKIECSNEKEELNKVNDFYNNFGNSLLNGPDWANHIYVQGKNHTVEMYNTIRDTYNIIKEST